MKYLIVVIFLFIGLFGFSQSYKNDIEGLEGFITGKQKLIILVKGPYQIDSSNYFIIATLGTDSMYFFYTFKNDGFRLNDTYEYKGVEELDEKLGQFNINQPEVKIEPIIEKVDEWAYREQLILIQSEECEDKFIKQKLLKVPYAKRIGYKWIYLNPARIIWLDKNGNEIKRV